MRADEHLLPYISELPPAPHNSVVLITSLSESTLRSLFDLAAPGSPSSPRPPVGSTPPDRGEIPGRGHPRQPSLVWRTVAYMLNLAVWSAVFVGLGYGGRWIAKKWRERQAARGGAVALSGGEDDELRIDLDSESEE